MMDPDVDLGSVETDSVLTLMECPVCQDLHTADICSTPRVKVFMSSTPCIRLFQKNVLHSFGLTILMSKPYEEGY